MNIARDVKNLSPGAYACLVALILGCAAIVIYAPEHMWSSLAKADPAHIAGIVTVVGSAIVGLFTRGTAPPVTPPPPVVLVEDDADDVDTVPLGPTRSPRHGGRS